MGQETRYRAVRNVIQSSFVPALAVAFLIGMGGPLGALNGSPAGVAFAVEAPAASDPTAADHAVAAESAKTRAGHPKTAGAPYAADKNEPLGFRSSISESADAMSTEAVWQIDPRERNPHRARWALKRTAALLNVKTPRYKNGFGIVAEGLDLGVEIHLRGPGPWYHAITDFECRPEPDAWFATQAGSRVAAEKAAESWVSYLKSEQVSLEIALHSIREDTEAAARTLGQQTLTAWIDTLADRWAVRGKSEARVAEWRSYLKEAAGTPVCVNRSEREWRAGGKGKNSATGGEPTWRDLVEAPATDLSQKIIARAPAKRFGGLYVIRLTVGYGDKLLNGQFLVDSGAGASIVSPYWLRAQGINPALAEVPAGVAQRVSSARGTSLARRTKAYVTQLGGVTLPFRDFLLMETELFGPPEFPNLCCDGILGSDFLKLFAVEFIPSSPAEVVFYDRAGYSGGSNQDWAEVALTPDGAPVSSGCELKPAHESNATKNSAANSAANSIVGARWDTGDQAGFDVHAPWKKWSQVNHGLWSMECPGVGTISAPTGVEYPMARSEHEGPWSERLPGFTVGMELLGRAPVTLDLGHGRIWFPKGLRDIPIRQNRSGVSVKFRLEGEDHNQRVLRVTALSGTATAARTLVKAGVKVGTQVTALNDTPTGSLDAWDIEQILSGARGTSVKFETLPPKAKVGRKVVPLVTELAVDLLGK